MLKYKNLIFLDVSLFYLKKNKIIGEDIIYTNQLLTFVGVCEKTGMINVCNFDEKSNIYFWVHLDDVENVGTVLRKFKPKDIHIKAINEKWTTEKNIRKDLRKKKNKRKITDSKEQKKRKLLN